MHGMKYLESHVRPTTISIDSVRKNNYSFVLEYAIFRTYANDLHALSWNKKD